jgi:hypothetical protein
MTKCDFALTPMAIGRSGSAFARGAVDPGALTLTSGCAGANFNSRQEVFFVAWLTISLSAGAFRVL